VLTFAFLLTFIRKALTRLLLQMWSTGHALVLRRRTINKATGSKPSGRGSGALDSNRDEVDQRPLPPLGHTGVYVRGREAYDSASHVVYNNMLPRLLSIIFGSQSEPFKEVLSLCMGLVASNPYTKTFINSS